MLVYHGPLQIKDIRMNQNSSQVRPIFPKRIVVTGGMPYGNKDLHFGHIGGMFVQADIFARFMRDRIGARNVLFVSGTDCYGSPIVEQYRQMTENGEFQGSIGDFVRFNHERQKEMLDAYGISLNLFAASGFGRSGEIHREMCGAFFRSLYENGFLCRIDSLQFYDAKAGAYLNGRQVVGRCPVPGCKSEKAYADECALGHPYEPRELIAPKSAITGDTPEMRSVSNWYINLEHFRTELVRWVEAQKKAPGYRPFAVSAIEEFLEPPTIYIKPDQREIVAAILKDLPQHEFFEEPNKPIRLVFKALVDREKANETLGRAGIRYRNGKTLVPFRLTGNVEWGLPAPDLEDDLKGLTFWVWPESLWAPISFSAAYLESQGFDPTEWKRWWTSRETAIYQFIGEDNVYFYSLAEMGMFMGVQGRQVSADPKEGCLQLPELVVNNHILFFDKKASSSGKIRPPMARDLLNHYTADQLRAHFVSLGLGIRSVSFKPRPFNPSADPREGDPVLKEGNLLCNAFNRAVRTCFYTAQKYFGGRIPVGEVSPAVLEESGKALLDFEAAMHRQEFHQAMAITDNYVRAITKNWSAAVKTDSGKELSGNDPVLRQALIDAFHRVRTATLMLHPIAPFGTEMIREYLGFDADFWNWERAFDTLYAFMKNPAEHALRVLEPRVDFFPKHPSQVQF
jgi:methionyl-tRNA synthetase